MSTHLRDSAVTHTDPSCHLGHLLTSRTVEPQTSFGIQPPRFPCLGEKKQNFLLRAQEYPEWGAVGDLACLLGGHKVGHKETGV